jgi:alpha-tubulin suppressor-like RCC1 family protein
MPAGLSGIKAISAGVNFSLALKDDGTVVAWGCTSEGLTPPAGLPGLVAISAGGEHALAMTAVP